MSSYAPVDFHGPSASVSTGEYYGSLLTSDNKPSDVFVRLSDALFIYIDSSCAVPTLQNTGVIEPAKYAWYMLNNGASVESAILTTGACRSYYELASLPYQLSEDSNGNVIPILDRRAFLRMAVFDARSDPENFLTEWSRAITRFELKDPLTSRSFPTPLPPSCLPSAGDPELRALISRWAAEVLFQASQPVYRFQQKGAESHGAQRRRRNGSQDSTLSEGDVDVNGTIASGRTRMRRGPGSGDLEASGDVGDHTATCEFCR